jgi:DNA-binding IclR family transcriptional regulator
MKQAMQGRRTGADRERPSTLKRAFAMLAILPLEGGVRLAEAAQRAALPKPTAHRILHALIELGQVIQDDASGRYRSAGRLSVPATATSDAIRAAALPTMQALHRRLNETVNLGMLEGERVRYLHVLDSDRPLRLITIPDSADPLHCTALGRAILSTMDADRRKTLISKLRFKARTSHTVTDAEELERILEVARRRGFAEEREENDLGVACVAAPLRGTAWADVAAISITIPTARYTPVRRSEILTALKELVP